jgi:hypothetical protein
VHAPVSSPTFDEQELIMAMYKTWEEGRAEARMEARIEEQADIGDPS